MSSARARVVLVIGGSGFLGAHLVRRLLERGDVVHAVVRASSNSWRLSDVRDRLTFWTGDVREAASIASCVGQTDPQVVYNLAGDPRFRRRDDVEAVRGSIDTHVTGTVNVLAAAREQCSRLARVVLTGGLEEYGDGSTPYDEGQALRPVSPYSAGQAAADAYAHMLGRRWGLPIVVLRPALVYGPGQSADFLIPALILQCLDHGTFEMTAGEQERDLVFVDDLIEAFLAAAEVNETVGETINIGTGQGHRMREVAEKIVELCGGGELKMGAGAKRASDIQRLIGSIQRARRLLNWRPRTTLHAGLRQTIEWYRDNRERFVPQRGDGA